MHTKLTITAVAGILALGLTGPTAASAQDPTYDTVIGHGCHEFMAYPTVPYEAAQALVSNDDFTVRSTPFAEDDPENRSTAKLWINVRHCESLEIFGQAVDDVIESYIAVPVRRPEFTPRDRESGAGVLDADAARVPNIRLENFLVQWVTTSKLRARWLRQHADLGEDQVLVIDGLVFDYKPVPEGMPGAVDESFMARVPAPAPSPFTIEARVTEPGGEVLDARQNQWWHTGMVIYADGTGAFGTGDGTIRSDDHTSPLGRAFGGEADDQARRTNIECHESICIPEPASFLSADGTWTKQCFRDDEWNGCS